jgi:hypothetical protein
MSAAQPFDGDGDGDDDAAVVRLVALHNLADHPRAESVAAWGVELDPLAADDDVLVVRSDPFVVEYMADYARDLQAGIGTLEHHRRIRNLRLDYSFVNGASIRAASAATTTTTTHGGNYHRRHEEEEAEGVVQSLYWKWRRRPGNGALARDVERLFRVVLPNHPTLESLEFVDCFQVPSPIVSTFLSGLPPRKRLAGLHFHKCSLCETSCQALAEALRRDAWIERLTIAHCRLSQESCRHICDAVAENRHVRAFALVEEHATPLPASALHRLLRSHCAALKELDIEVSFERYETRSEAQAATESPSESDELTRLLALLRTNGGLKDLTVRNVILPSRVPMFRELVQTYNFSLRRLELPHAPEYDRLLINRIVESNGRVREDWGRIQAARAPHKAQNKALPEAISRVGLFRLLREPDNASILTGLLEQGRRHGKSFEGRSRRRGKRTRPSRGNSPS